MNFKHYLIVALAFNLVHCGNNYKSTDTATTDAKNLANDSETSMALVSVNMDEAVSSTASGDLASDTANALRDNTHLSNEITRSRTCVENATDKSATVTMEFSGTHLQTTRNITLEHIASGSETRVWTNPVSGKAISCGPLSKYVKINWLDVNAVNGLKLVDTTNRSHTFKRTFTRNQKTVTTSLEQSESGTRTVTWSLPTGATDTTSTTKTAVINVTHTVKMTKMNGYNVDFTATHATLENSPMVVTKVSDASTGDPKSFTIVSGTMSVTKTDRFYITNAYEKVGFDLSSSTPCVPNSGTITTKIYNTSTDTSPVKTFTITFSSSGATVTGDSTATDNFNDSLNDSCSFKN